jgi:hypothetical protein
MMDTDYEEDEVLKRMLKTPPKKNEKTGQTRKPTPSKVKRRASVQ